MKIPCSEMSNCNKISVRVVEPLFEFIQILVNMRLILPWLEDNVYAAALYENS